MTVEGTDSPRSSGPHNTWPGRTAPTWTGIHSYLADSSLDAGWKDRIEPDSIPARWVGRRLWWLVACALAGALGFAVLVFQLSNGMQVDATWRADALGHIVLVRTADSALRPHIDQALTGVIAADGMTTLPDTLALQRSPRWVIADDDRARQQRMQQQMAAAMGSEAKLFFSDGSKVDVQPVRRGLASLPVAFWLFGGLAFALYLSMAGALIVSTSPRNAAYALMAACQSGNALLMAMAAAFQFGLPPALDRASLPLQVAFDLFTAAGMVNVVCLHPRQLQGSGWIALFGWCIALVLAGAAAFSDLHDVWWWTQGAVLGLGVTAVCLLTWSYQIEPHPLVILLRRFGLLTCATWALLTLALATANQRSGLPHNIADIGATTWYVYMASLLLVAPSLSKSRSVLREFSLLAAVCTIAVAIDLLLVGVFSLSPFAALVLSVFVALGIYSGVRHWALSQLLGRSTLTPERMFEQLYRMAREVEAQPERAPELLSQLLGHVFEPLETAWVERQVSKTRLASDGSSLLVPVPPSGDEAQVQGSVMIRFADRGRRLFTSEDVRLTDRLVEQLRRAVHFDRAVEQGRSEERLRLAQDLHDDIGARLLTLMYKSQSAEMEDYVRHTLQDLKTLTRGLAASNHRLSHASAEWKADLTHRLTAAHIDLTWTFAFDEDVLLTVVHWSALTRILRELVSNVIAHANAQRLAIDFKLENGRIDLTITDNGMGRNPREWSHGLGLGGVRKRVKQLGGEVEWREADPRGIRCRVVIHELTGR